MLRIQNSPLPIDPINCVFKTAALLLNLGGMQKAVHVFHEEVLRYPEVARERACSKTSGNASGTKLQFTVINSENLLTHM